MNSQIVQASAREALEAYMESLERLDFEQASFWRSIVIERLEVLSGSIEDSPRPYGADGS